MQKNYTLKEKWSHFKNIIFDPWVVFLFIITLFLIYSSDSNFQEPQKTTLTLILSIVSGVLGGLIAKKWMDIFEQKLIVARGVSAIRSLKLLLLNIAAIEKRVKVYLLTLTSKKINIDVVKTNFEEIVEKCKILEEEGMSAIENWTDIIPEANVKTQIGLISELNNREMALLRQIDQMRKEFDQNKEMNDEEKSKLQNEIGQKAKELSALRDDLHSKTLELSAAGMMGIAGSTQQQYFWEEPLTKTFEGLSFMSPKLQNQVCEKCGNQYLGVENSIVKLCSDCIVSH